MMKDKGYDDQSLCYMKIGAVQGLCAGVTVSAVNDAAICKVSLSSREIPEGC